MAGLSQAWSLQLVAINKNLGSKALPAVTHDLELSCDGCQLALCRVCNIYCESVYFHISFIVSAGPGSMEYIAVSSAPEPVCDFTNLLHREITKRGQDCILSYLGQAVKLGACGLKLVTFFFHNFFLAKVPAALFNGPLVRPP